MATLSLVQPSLCSALLTQNFGHVLPCYQPVLLWFALGCVEGESHTTTSGFVFATSFLVRDKLVQFCFHRKEMSFTSLSRVLLVLIDSGECGCGCTKRGSESVWQHSVAFSSCAHDACTPPTCSLFAPSSFSFPSVALPDPNTGIAASGALSGVLLPI